MPVGQAVKRMKISAFQPIIQRLLCCMAVSHSKYWNLVKARVRDPLIFIIAAVALVIAAINVSVKLSDAAGFGAAMPWQNPVTTEYSSVVALILLLPLLFGFFSLRPVSLKTWQSLLLPYLGASIVFSLAHVFLMVAMRTAVWPLLFSGPYSFFNNGFGALLYEYQKDAVTFVSFVLISELQRQVGLAKAKSQQPEPIALKSGAATILLQPAEFLFAKSAGNYAEVTSLSGTQLARITLAELEATLQGRGCDAVRVHRSYIVNRGAIMETSPIAGGDLMIKLRGGDSLRASRRYKDALGV